MGRKVKLVNQVAEHARKVRHWVKAYWRSEERVYAEMKNFIHLTPYRGYKVEDLTEEEWYRVYDLTKLMMSKRGDKLVPTPPQLRNLGR